MIAEGKDPIDKCVELLAEELGRVGKDEDDG